LGKRLITSGHGGQGPFGSFANVRQLRATRLTGAYGALVVTLGETTLIGHSVTGGFAYELPTLLGKPPPRLAGQVRDEPAQHRVHGDVDIPTESGT
jgi:hypothetical protein